jgi:hypothetical protein
VLAKAESVPLRSASVEIAGELDPANPVRTDVNVFSSVRLSFQLVGVTEEQGTALVEGFKRR